MAESYKRANEISAQRLAELNLSPEEQARYKKKFDSFDLNKDGMIDLREFQAVSKIFGYTLGRDEILEMFGRTDLDDNSGILFDEFVVAMKRRAGTHRDVGDVRGKFREYDKKKRGYITTDEALPILKRDLGFDEAKTETLLYMFDKNNDYRLSLLEFIDFQRKVEELKSQVQQAFKEFDQNRDGYVDLAEAKAVMLPRGCTEQQVENLFRKADENNDNRLDYSEFAAFWDIPIN
jgi:Ca2+-binding EF-hand superfamily protein